MSYRQADEVTVGHWPNSFVFHVDHSVFVVGGSVQDFKFEQHFIDFGEGVGLVEELDDFLNGVVNSCYSFGGDPVIDLNFEDGAGVGSVGSPVGVVLHLFQLSDNVFAAGF
jgi:hypothetical protein